MPDDSGVTVVTMLVCFLFFAYEAAGASRARHSLRPHLCWAGKFMHHSGVEPPRERGGVCGLSDGVIASLALAMTAWESAYFTWSPQGSWRRLFPRSSRSACWYCRT